MNAEQLLTHFDRIADAPDAIPRLRRFILDLAVRGKLAEQDPNDEPAAELLKRIAAEKRRLVKAGEIKKSKVNEVKIAGSPFNLPNSWQWAALGNLFLYDAGIKREPKALDRTLWLLELEDVEKDTATLLARITAAERESKSTKSEFRVDDILYGKLRPYLNKVLVADKPGYSTTEIVALRPYISLCSKYCALALRRPDFVNYVTQLGQGTKMPRLRTEDAIVAPFPLPPLAEQHRIVAKVDELMALCDRLETAWKEREATRNRLAATSLARLNAPDPDPAVFQNHATFALDNLIPLTIRPDQIKALRQTILNLAVRGKLVEQDREDEPAAELLKKITETRRSLIVESKMKRSKDLPPVEDKEIKFGIPAGWAVTRMGIAYDVRDGTHDSPKYVDDGYPLITSKNLSSGHLSFDDTKLIGKEDYIKISQRSTVVKGDILLAMIGSIGNPVIVDTDQPFAIKNVALLKYFDPNCSDPEFLRFFLLNAANEMKALAAGGLQPFVSLSFLRNYPLAIPPLAEQHRIVAKVDELMGLCDRLEASLAAGDETRGRLLEALLHRAISGGVAPDDGSDNSGLDNSIQTRELEMS